MREFFGGQFARELADAGKQADLVIGNNVYAHVPDLNDFTAGIRTILKTGGTVTLEFPHLLRLIEDVQFDTVYHEHFSYFSLDSVCGVFKRAGLRVFDVEALPTHGGSLRVYGCHEDDARGPSPAVSATIAAEKQAGLHDLGTYAAFQTAVDRVKDAFVEFLIDQKRAGRRVAGYGAAAKGNTLLNYAGIKPDLLPYVCDAAPSKQGKFMPGSHIPICQPAELVKRKPDTVLILPWNISRGGGCATWICTRVGSDIFRRCSSYSDGSMRTLVTGATGFIGRHVVQRLLERGHDVTAVARSSRGDEDLPWRHNVRFLAANLHDRIAEPYEFLGRPQAVVHLAWPNLPNYQSRIHLDDTLPADRRFLRSMIAGGLRNCLSRVHA